MPYFSPQVKNKPYQPREEYAFFLECGAVTNSYYFTFLFFLTLLIMIHTFLLIL
jgi:hypothetical protein